MHKNMHKTTCTIHLYLCVPTEKPFNIGVAVIIFAVTVVSVAVAVSAAATVAAAVVSSAAPFS